MSLPTPTGAAPDVPTPPRFRWLKRVVVAGVIWLIVLCVLRWVWGWEADRRLAAVIADAEARGEPVLEEDFRPAAVPDGENAAGPLMEAAESVLLISNFYRLNEVDEFEDVPPGDMQTIASAVGANDKPLALVRLASTRPAVSWPPPSNQPNSRRWRMDQGQLGKLLLWAAIYDHESRHDVEAMALVKDLIRQADALGGQPTEFIDRLMSLVAEARAVAVVDRLSRPTKTPLQPEFKPQAHEIISLLLRDDYYHQADVKAVYAVRKQALGAAGRIDEFVEFPPLDRMVLRPMYVLDVARAAREFGEMARASQAPTITTLSSRTRSYEPFEPYLFRRTRPMGMGWGSGRITDFYKAAVRRRAAAVKLAIRLYRDDHEGRLPPRLDDLVPQYLPAVPRDAMAADNRPLSYRPDAKTPLIYSVGSDGKDNGGVESIVGGSDDVFYLEAPPPKPPRVRRPPASRQAQQHQANPNDARNQAPAQRR